MLHPENFFDLANFEHPELFQDANYVWDALKRLKEYLANHRYPLAGMLPRVDGPLPRTLIIHGDTVLDGECDIEFGDATKGKLTVFRNGELLPGASVLMAGTVLVGSRFALGQGVLVESGAFLKEPLIIGDGTEVRQGAYLRGNCLVGQRCVVGHVTEAKHSIFLDDAKAGHFAYLGDSILGNNVNLGAGTKAANLRFLAGDINVRTPAGPVPTGLKKLGAILGDGVQTGCNSVTSPGTLLGRKAMLLPNTTAPSGLHPDGAMIR